MIWTKFLNLKSLKWIAIISLLFGIIYGIKSGLESVYDYHLNQIEEAVIAERLRIERDEKEVVDNATRKLKEANAEEKAQLRRELSNSRKKLNDLRRMLLIEHDLDRLLQEKPDLIIPKVNKGTEEVLQELEELTK